MVELNNRNPEVVDAVVDAGRLQVNSVQAGVAIIEMRLGFDTGTAEVFVPPARVHRIEIEPSPVVIDNGGRVEVVARLYGEAGDSLSAVGHRISWDVLGGGTAGSGVSFSDIGVSSFLRAATFPSSTLPVVRTLVLVVDHMQVTTQITIQ